jgi:hypothetical protein
LSQQQFEPVHVGGGDKIVATLKAGNAFEDPWVVIHADTLTEAHDLLGAAVATGLMAVVAKASEQFKADYRLGKTVGAQPVQSPAAAEQSYYQQQAPQQPQGQPQQQYQQAPPQQNQQWQQQPAQQDNGPKPGTRLTVPQGVQIPNCPHGTKSLVAGKFGPFWGCNAQQGDPSKCKAEKYNGPAPF